MCNELRPGWILKTPGQVKKTASHADHDGAHRLLSLLKLSPAHPLTGSDDQQVLRAALVTVSAGPGPS